MALAILFFLLGLIVGSFLNVVILRHGARSIQGRSGCMHCGRQLVWYDMIPVVSWIALRGKCRFCRGKISVQYPLVEVLTALCFGLLAAAPFFQTIGFAGPILLLLSCAIASCLLIIAVYDARHTIIPESWVWIFNALTLVCALILIALVPTSESSWPILAGGLFAAAPLFFLWLVSRGAWMGFGDVKLALGIGWVLGPVFGVVAVFFAFVIGAIVSVTILLPLPYYVRMWKQYASRFTPTSVSSRKGAGFTMKSEVAFGPFLIASTFIIWFAILYGVPLPLL